MTPEKIQINKAEIREKLTKALNELQVARQRIEQHAENVGIPVGELRDSVGRYMIMPFAIAEIEGYSALARLMDEEEEQRTYNRVLKDL